MDFLLDTHAFLWWTLNDPSLPRRANEAMRNPQNKIFVSAATAWEITTKYRIGKLPAGVGEVARDVAEAIRLEGFSELPVTVAHGQHAGALAGAHKDPFDRMLIAQALAEDMVLISNETLFDAFGVQRLW